MQRKFTALCDKLLSDVGGVTSVVKALPYLGSKHPCVRRLETELSDFGKNRHRMSYAEWREQGLMIG